MNRLNSLSDTYLQMTSVFVPEGCKFAKPELSEEGVFAAKQAIETATSENIIERCQHYLVLLDDYRNELYKFRGNPVINRQLKFSLTSEVIDTLRKQIRGAVEKTTRERNKIESLLKSFTSISGYEAAETLNRLRYKGFDDWELKAGGVRAGGGAGEADQISVQAAVALASLLRRDEYVAAQTIQAKQIGKEKNDDRVI